MGLTGSAEEAALRSVKRACYAGLDSVALRTEVVRRIAPVVPHDAYSFATSDPDTGLFTHVVVEGVPEETSRVYAELVYPQQEAMRMLDRVRSGEDVSTQTSALFAEMLCAAGMGRELNTVLCARGGLWGDLCFLRESRSAAYTEREMRFMRRIAPHVARGLKVAATLDLAKDEAVLLAGGAELSDSAPGVVVVDGRGRIVLRNPAASPQLEDLADVGVKTGNMPYALLSAVSLLHARHRQMGIDDAPEDAALQVRGRSGRWYTLRASLSEPTERGDMPAVVTIQPAAPREIATILTRLYGLSPREREIIALTARGASTKAIAAQVGLSTYTVQEHLGNACDKVGVRGRKALLAKLFFDGYAPRLAG
ncbi:MAG: LuxR C-terminal-related transcriptional regulator [Gemmatimonadetes bacterium]|nr:LuxR C-terminal-related transcriptional regulator [Gemmatimonadota bacterium]